MVIATTISAAKIILAPLKGLDGLNDFFRLPTMSAVTFQLELNQSALKKDITSFGPQTLMICFAEQSRSTFPESKGRVSIILGCPDYYLEKTTEYTLEMILKDAEALGINLRDLIVDYRKINHDQSFYSLEKGYHHLRPGQRTNVKGLTLAGDYTLTPFFATMEGAVVSGIKAAENIIAASSTFRR